MQAVEEGTHLSLLNCTILLIEKCTGQESYTEKWATGKGPDKKDSQT